MSRGSHAPARAQGPWNNPANAIVGYAVDKTMEAFDDIDKGRKARRKKLEYNGTFLLVVINCVLFGLAVLGYRTDWLMLNHMKPRWFQFITSIFCHASWQHLSSNLFLLYIFGKLVEEEEGMLGVWMTYIVCGVGGSIASMMLSPKNAVSMGASGAVFGLFVVSVLVRVSQQPQSASFTNFFFG